MPEGCNGPVWRHSRWEYPEPCPPEGTPCVCGVPFEYHPWVTANFSVDGVVDAEAYEEFRGLWYDFSLVAELDNFTSGEGKPVRRREIDDLRWEHAGTRGWLEGQQDHTRKLGL